MGIALLIIWPFYMVAYIAYEGRSSKAGENDKAGLEEILLTAVGVILFILLISVFTSAVYA